MSVLRDPTREFDSWNQYLACWQSDISWVQAVLQAKSWIGFDLDDTLHGFRRSSSLASDKVLEQIHGQYGMAVSDLKEIYGRVLRAKTAHAFTDGKTSRDYRRERLAGVLAAFNITEYDDGFMTGLLELYETTLIAALELKAGALELMATIKALGKKIVIITEGLQDAQDRTVSALGIARYVDLVATTKTFGCSKTNGLFLAVLVELGITPHDIAYVGDNEQRDIKPALAEGIFAIHFAEMKDISLDIGSPRVSTLHQVQFILEFATSIDLHS